MERTEIPDGLDLDEAVRKAERLVALLQEAVMLREQLRADR